MRKRNIDFTKGTLLPLIITYAIPLILSGLVQTMFNAADMAVLGAFDKSSDSSAVGAVGATGAIISLLVNSFIGLSGGTNIILARSVGARDDERSQKIVGSSLILAVSIGVVMTLVGMITAPWFLTATNCPANTYDGALTYLRIYISATPAILIYNYGAAIIRVSGDSKSPFTYILIAGVTNVILNVILCFILPNKVAAVAIATLTSNVVGAALTVAHLLRLKEGPCRVNLKNLQFSWRETANIVLLGLPNAFNSALYSISNLQIQGAINSFGSSASAGNNASAQVESFLATTVQSISTTCMVAVGQNIGANEKNRVKNTIVRCAILNFSIALILGLGALALGRPLLRIFLPNDALAVEIGMVRLACLLSLYSIMALDSTLSHSVRAFGSTLFPMLNAVFTVILFRTIWMNFIYPYMTFVGDPVKDIFNVYECYMISWTLSFVVQVAIFAVFYKRYIRGKGKEV
ncbi:MAG: hypothetical protein IJW53_02465 [Clostridia bacterium]|nr:hypothetical protein [Clostridia bacterium]